jgi:hypothetical protein
MVEGQLLIGVMAWSKKADDLRRDLRYVLHSPVTGPDSSEGNSSCTDRPLRSARTMTAPRPDPWWLAFPPGTAIMFCLRIKQALFVDWDTGMA